MDQPDLLNSCQNFVKVIIPYQLRNGWNYIRRLSYVEMFFSSLEPEKFKIKRKNYFVIKEYLN